MAQLDSDPHGLLGREGELAGSRNVEVDASHAVSVSQPEAVARLIDEAARATTG